MRFRLIGLSTPILPTLCFKDSQVRDATVYSELHQNIKVVSWNKLAVFWQLENMKNSPLLIDNNLLKHNGEIVVYIYIYIYVRVYQLYNFLLYLRDRQLKYMARTVFLCDLVFRRVRLLLERLYCLERFLFLFSCLLYGHRISSLFPTLKPSIFLEDSTGNKLFQLAHQSSISSDLWTTFWLFS